MQKNYGALELVKKIRDQLAVLNKISAADPFAVRSEQLLDEEIAKGPRKAQLQCLLSEIRMAIQDTVERDPSGNLAQIAAGSMRSDEDILAHIVAKGKISSDDEYRDVEEAVARIIEKEVADDKLEQLIGMTNEHLAAYVLKRQRD